MQRKLKHLSEAMLAMLAWCVFRVLPLDAASWLGGQILRAIGPQTRKHKIALVNLGIAFPEKSEEERKKIARGMWEHLGRVIAEFMHFRGNALLSRISASGLEHLPAEEKPGILVSGHFGNWEMTYPVAYESGVPVTLVYRQANNPFMDWLICRLRKAHANEMLQKGFRGAPKMARALKSGHSIAMLVDQKMNDGIAVPFFGRDTMAAPAFAQFALRFDLPVVPARVVRLRGAHFKGTAYPPVEIKKTGNDEADAKAMVCAVYRQLEGWIREYPEQWLWIHRRWEKELYA